MAKSLEQMRKEVKGLRMSRKRVDEYRRLEAEKMAILRSMKRTPANNSKWKKRLQNVQSRMGNVAQASTKQIRKHQGTLQAISSFDVTNPSGKKRKKSDWWW